MLVSGAETRLDHRSRARELLRSRSAGDAPSWLLARVTRLAKAEVEFRDGFAAAVVCIVAAPGAQGSGTAGLFGRLAVGLAGAEARGFEVARDLTVPAAHAGVTPQHSKQSNKQTPRTDDRFNPWFIVNCS